MFFLECNFVRSTVGFVARPLTRRTFPTPLLPTCLTPMPASVPCPLPQSGPVAVWLGPYPCTNVSLVNASAITCLTSNPGVPKPLSYLRVRVSFADWGNAAHVPANATGVDLNTSHQVTAGRGVWAGVHSLGLVEGCYRGNWRVTYGVGFVGWLRSDLAGLFREGGSRDQGGAASSGWKPHDTTWNLGSALPQYLLNGLAATSHSPPPRPRPPPGCPLTPLPHGRPPHTPPAPRLPPPPPPQVSYRYIDLWSRRSTWGGGDPPVEGDSVVVPAGVCLTGNALSY